MILRPVTKSIALQAVSDLGSSLFTMPALVSTPSFISSTVAGADGRSHASRSISSSKEENACEQKKLPSSLLLSKKGLSWEVLPLTQGLKSSHLPISDGLITSIRPKQVTDPLGEAVRARLYGHAVSTDKAGAGYESTGSDQEPSSVCLAAMVHEFIENEHSKCGRARCNCSNGACNRFVALQKDTDDSKSSFGGEPLEILEGLVTCASKTERILLAELARALDEIVKEGSSCKIDAENCRSNSRKPIVMKILRRAGYNAAICKSRWDNCGGFPAGEYEYMDVMFETARGQTDRLIVDLDFRAQFEIARPTNLYLSMLRTLPPIFVGNSGRLQQILNVMSNFAKESLKKKGLHLPPWRKPEYMRAKWFSQYKRTTDEDVQVHRKEGNLQFAEITRRDNARIPNELEVLYYEAGAKKGHCTAFETKGLGKIDNRFKLNEITVMSTDWQLPAVNLRKPLGKSVRFAGLASVFVQAAE